MSDDRRDFEDTMDVLEAQRERAEARFQELLEELSAQVEAVRHATNESTRLYHAQVEARRQALASVKDGLEQARDHAPAALTWPAGGGVVRRSLNLLARWALRDYLEVLDRRGDARTRRVEELRERVDRLQATVSIDGEAAEPLNRALASAQAALQAALTTHAEMLNLVNAKDAEVLQRAVAGPLRRMEVLFDEFGRQQEALLSQLVGRRRELDALVRSVVPANKEEM